MAVGRQVFRFSARPRGAMKASCPHIPFLLPWCLVTVNMVYEMEPIGKIRHNVQLGTRFEPRLIARVDEWRRQQPDIPTRSEAMRRLLDRALDAEVATQKASASPTPLP